MSFPRLSFLRKCSDSFFPLFASPPNFFSSPLPVIVDAQSCIMIHQSGEKSDVDRRFTLLRIVHWFSSYETSSARHVKFLIIRANIYIVRARARKLLLLISELRGGLMRPDV